MTTMFTVEGPAIITPEVKNKRKMITTECVENFWREHHHLRDKAGCYIFALANGPGFTPWYVGKTERTFEKQALQPRNLTQFNEVLFSGVKGKPVMFFVVLPTKRGKNNGKAIKELEFVLIQQAATANPDLLNVHNTKQPQWGIKGILHSEPGKPPREAQVFKSMMSW